mgnify:CR=1 FL=1
MDIYNSVRFERELSRQEGVPNSIECLRTGNFQVNYSVLNPGIVKAWHRHKNQDDYFCVVKGMAQIGTYSDKDGPEKYFIGEHNPAIVKIPAGEWHGLKALGNEPCGLLYFVTNLFDLENPDEERAGPFDFVESTWWEPECK